MSKRPTGTAGVAATLLVLLLSHTGLDLPMDVAVAFIGLVTAAVSALSPRVTEQIFHLTPEAVAYLHELDAALEADLPAGAELSE
jgi:hypothetical protein